MIAQHILILKIRSTRIREKFAKVADRRWFVKNQPLSIDLSNFVGYFLIKREEVFVVVNTNLQIVERICIEIAS